MAINKVVINTASGEETLIDLTGDSVTPETLAEGATAHSANGEVIRGVMPTSAVLYTAQTLTEAQKAQARANIDAMATDELQQGVNDALAQAKASGEFDGAAGQNGTSVTVKSVSESTADGGSNVVTFSDGKTLTVKNGKAGTNGTNGTNGTSVTVSNVSESTASGGTNVVTFSDGKKVNIKNGINGTNGTNGTNGKDGKTPVRGTDYWTEADQESIVQQVITALGTPVFGTVDANNNIILSGNLSDGTYTIKYEDAEGNLTEIGTLKSTSAPTYTNILPLAINSNGTPFVGTNGEQGYKTNTRLGSGGTESTSNATGMEVTGFMPVVYNDTLYFKDVEVIKKGTNSDKCYFTIYNSSFAKIADRRMDGGDADGAFAWDENNNIKSVRIVNNGGFSANVDNAAYLRFSATEINSSSIITKNEPIE